MVKRIKSGDPLWASDPLSGSQELLHDKGYPTKIKNLYKDKNLNEEVNDGIKMDK
jgi:hypothetical protein